jgi:SAM-dependent methyltransferase
MSSSANKPFRRDEVADYERRRYRGLDQRIVDRRERRILDRLFREVGPADRATPLLDAPCGYGRFSAFLLARSDFLVSCDLSAAMVERAVAREAPRMRSRGVVADLKAGLPFGSETFAAVCSMRFFHHLHHSQDRRAVLREFHRVSGRWAVVSFYRLNPLHRLQRRLRRRIKASRTRIKMITREEFETEAREAGWEVVRLSPLLRGIHGQHIALLEKAGARERRAR